MKQYDDGKGAIHFIQDNEEPKEGWVEIIRDPNARPDPNYIPSYTVRRMSAYPRIQEQLDLLWHDIDNDLIPGKDSAWYNTIKKVKDDNPKLIQNEEAI